MELSQTIDGFKTTVSDTYATNSSVTEKVSAVSQTADKINWLVKSGTSASDVTLTDRAYSVIAENINLTGKVTFNSLTSDAKTSISNNTLSSIYSPNTTTINGGIITTGSINSNALNVNSLSAITANLGTVTAGILKSSNYIANVSGMLLNLANGTWDSKYFKLSSTGAITATYGAIAGWDISADSICKVGTGISSLSSKLAIWAGESNGALGTINSDANFKVEHDGHMVAVNADISGKITATSGKIAGFDIDEDSNIHTDHYNATLQRAYRTYIRTCVDDYTWAFSVYTKQTNDWEGVFYVTGAGDVHCAGDVYCDGHMFGAGDVYCNGKINSGSIEIVNDTNPCIDFYYNSSSNYTSRLYDNGAFNQFEITKVNGSINLQADNGISCRTADNSGWSTVQAGIFSTPSTNIGDYATHHSLLRNKLGGTIQLWTDQSVQVRNVSDTAWMPVRASSFQQNSTEDQKTNIIEVTDVLSILNSASVYKYNRIFDLERGISNLEYGFVIGNGYNTPQEVLTDSRDSINLYSMTSILWKGTQEIYKKVNENEKRINELESKLAIAQALISALSKGEILC